MKYLLLLLAVGVALAPTRLVGQQRALAYSQSIGIRAALARSAADTLGRDTLRNRAAELPTPIPYLAVGGVAGALTGAVILAYKIFDGVQNGGVWMGQVPMRGIARYIGGGLVAGAFAGLVVYALDNPPGSHSP
ncbi:MAG TPA: hypothetical protein VJ840_06425 [Gemmatimonadaceae bacterium]|nr:hypothetical protein [Gemmatimonadaceae bacterium]